MSRDRDPDQPGGEPGEQNNNGVSREHGARIVQLLRQHSSGSLDLLVMKCATLRMRLLAGLPVLGGLHTAAADAADAHGSTAVCALLADLGKARTWRDVEALEAGLDALDAPESPESLGEASVDDWLLGDDEVPPGLLSSSATA